MCVCVCVCVCARGGVGGRGGLMEPVPIGTDAVSPHPHQRKPPPRLPPRQVLWRCQSRLRMAPPSVLSTTTFSFPNRLNLGPRAVTWAPFVPDRRQRRLTPGGRLAPVWSGQPPDPRLSGPVFRPLVRVSADWAAASAGHCMYMYVCGSVVAGLTGKGLSKRSTCTCRAVLHSFSFSLSFFFGGGGGGGALRQLLFSLFFFLPLLQGSWFGSF